MAFPDRGDPEFQHKVNKLQEYQFFGVPPPPFVATEEEFDKRVDKACSGFEKTVYQHLMQHYLSSRSHLRGLLLYHGLGVGKTCSSITIAESLMTDHSTRMGAKIWVVLPHALQKSYEEQVFNVARLLDKDFLTEQCMGDKYRRMIYSIQDPEAAKKKIQSLIKSRYAMFTYEGFASEIQRLKETGSYKEAISNKVIIVDEAHNLRIQETDKRAAQALMDVAKDGVNNKIVLLTATPMYNEPDEIFWLLSVLCANDKRHDVLRRLPSLFTAKNTPNKAAFDVLRQLASEYVSYIKSGNPFIFAARLTPRDNGIPTFESREGWEVSLKDGLVPTKCSAFQVEATRALKGGDATQHQALNVSYPTQNGAVRVGERGFFSVFRREVETDPVYVTYIPGMENALFPTEDKLGRIAPKIQRICDIIKKSEGIVVIYSQFVWSGVFPVAVALEHMGFKRHGGSRGGVRNIVKNADLVDPPVRYPGIPFPSYCILSGEAAVMGNTKIEDILRDVNSARNKHGEVVKVIIMSPVAGEGLSLKNVREVHILDPWYHTNRLEQVIGRAFRTCKHITLPLQERNVTVYLHVATDPSGKDDTVDIKSYQIAARKAFQMDAVEKVIRDAAIDCPLLKHLNYFPKDLFGFDVMMRSSQGVVVPYHFGDAPDKMPFCADPSADPDATSVRKEVYKELIPTGVMRVKKYVKNNPRIYYTAEELQQAVEMHPTITKSVLIEAMNDRTFGLAMHRNGFALRPHTSARQESSPLKIRIKSETKTEESADDCGEEFIQIIAGQPTADANIGKILIYKMLNAKCWNVFAKMIIEKGRNVPDNITPHVRILSEEGAFIGTDELPRHRNPLKNPYIGFVDIFDTTTPFHVILYDHDRNMFRDATELELNAIKAKRREVVRPPDSELYAVMEPHTYKKKFDVPVTNEIKIFTPSTKGGKQKGVVCESLKKNDTVNYIGQLGATAETSATKEQLCFTLGLELARAQKLFFSPNFKPT